MTSQTEVQKAISEFIGYAIAARAAVIERQGRAIQEREEALDRLMALPQIQGNLPKQTALLSAEVLVLYWAERLSDVFHVRKARFEAIDSLLDAVQAMQKVRESA